MCVVLQLDNVRDCIKCKYLEVVCALWQNTVSVVSTLLSKECCL